jgi:hypothetical protein
MNWLMSNSWANRNGCGDGDDEEEEENYYCFGATANDWPLIDAVADVSAVGKMAMQKGTTVVVSDSDGVVPPLPQIQQVAFVVAVRMLMSLMALPLPPPVVPMLAQ